MLRKLGQNIFLFPFFILNMIKWHGWLMVNLFFFMSFIKFWRVDGTKVILLCIVWHMHWFQNTIGSKILLWCLARGCGSNGNKESLWIEKNSLNDAFLINLNMEPFLVVLNFQPIPCNWSKNVGGTYFMVGQSRGFHTIASSF